MSEIALPIAGVPELPGPVRLLSDERLARLASRGSERAFATLYERHHQALYRYCLSIVRNQQDAQDALQSALARALAALQASERDLAVRPWLFRIAHNEAVSILRRRRAGDRVLDEQEPSLLDVEHTVEQRERLRRLVSDLQALPLRQRAALLMRELSGLSIEEIAAALSTSPGAAKQTLFEARSSLQAFAEGREMECETVRRAISDGDGRVLRGRRMRAHLRECPDCEEFRALIARRGVDLRALALPLPAAASAALLKQVLAHGAAGSHAGGLAASSAGVVGGHAAGSLVVKGLAGVAVLAAAGAGTAHLISAPPSRHAPTPATASHAQGPATPGAATGPSALPSRPASAAPRNSGPPAATATPTAVPAPQGESAPASGEGRLAGASTGARSGKKLARGNGRSGSAKGRHGAHRVQHEHRPQHPLKRVHERHATGPDAAGKASPATPRASGQGDGASETATQGSQPGAQAHTRASSPAASTEAQSSSP
jgi:RNA polymerase sigma factor (sigma-70 family)